MWRFGFQFRECGHRRLLPCTTGATVWPAILSGCAAARDSNTQKVGILNRYVC